MAYRENYKSEIDEYVLSLIPDVRHSHPSRGFSVSQLCSVGLRVGTVRNSLKRLLDAGMIQRWYDGNERFGRYVYSQAAA